MTEREPLVMHPDHQIMVTPGPFGRAWFDCTCRPQTNATFPSIQSANGAALRHLHEVNGACACPAWVQERPYHPTFSPPPGGAAVT